MALSSISDKSSSHKGHIIMTAFSNETLTINILTFRFVSDMFNLCFTV